MVLNVHTNHKAFRDGKKGWWGGRGGEGGGGKRVWRWGKKEGDYIHIATLPPPRMIPAVRWSAMRAIFNVS